MKSLDVYFTVGEAEPTAVQGATAVVVDVLRATTSIVEALANGARAVYPTASTEEAVHLAASLGREDVLLCGERNGVRIEGFDLGNSPYEFDGSAVGGKRLVMSTTNGTQALLAVQEATTVAIAAFTNLAAVADAVAGADRLVLQCAGRRGRFSIDDALCAGHLVRRIVGGGVEPVLNDAARAAQVLGEAVEPTRAFFEGTAAGRALTEIGLADDLDLCAEVDRRDIVPYQREKVITITKG